MFAEAISQLVGSCFARVKLDRPLRRRRLTVCGFEATEWRAMPEHPDNPLKNALVILSVAKDPADLAFPAGSDASLCSA